MLSKRDEHKELYWSNFKFSTVESGKFSGRHEVETLSLFNKSCKVIFTNTTRRDNKGYLGAIECIGNDITCVVLWIHNYRQLCHPEQKCFYCYKVSAKIIKLSYFISIFLSKSIQTIL